MLAKTLIPAPRVLLLDEPASGVDPQGRIDLKNILRRLAEEKKTVLISSHILAEMNEFCTSVAIMERGSLVVSGRIDDVNRRVMGDTLLSVEVLGEPEIFLSIVAGRRAGRPGRAQERCLRVSVPRRRRGGQRAAGDARAARRSRRVVRAPQGQPRRAVPQGRVEGAVLMNWERIRDWFDNPILVKHVRSRLRKQPLLTAIVVVQVLCLCIAWAGYQLGTLSVRRGVWLCCRSRS